MRPPSSASPRTGSTPATGESNLRSEVRLLGRALQALPVSPTCRSAAEAGRTSDLLPAPVPCTALHPAPQSLAPASWTAPAPWRFPPAPSPAPPRPPQPDPLNHIVPPISHLYPTPFPPAPHPPLRRPPPSVPTPRASPVALSTRAHPPPPRAPQPLPVTQGFRTTDQIARKWSPPPQFPESYDAFPCPPHDPNRARKAPSAGRNPTEAASRHQEAASPRRRRRITISSKLRKHRIRPLLGGELIRNCFSRARMY